MRRGEILGLNWSDINTSKKVMRDERSMSYIPNKGYVFTNLKTKSSRRYIPIPDLIAKELITHEAFQDVWT
jgi:integrase